MCKSLVRGLDADGLFSGFAELPGGVPVKFSPNAEGGGTWNGQFDKNQPGEFGYTYGTVIVHGKAVSGYVCHGTRTFRTQSEEGQRLIGQLPELTLEQRR